MFRLRTQRLFAWLSILALLGQLVLPTAHAQSWAARSGNPLLYAFCGQMSPALARQFLEVAPPELLSKLQQQTADVALDCDLCTSVHGHSLAGLPGAPVLALLDGDAAHEAVVAPAAPWVALVQLPQSRAPPALI